MSTRIPRGCEVDRQLRGLGWSRTRKRNRSNKRQPEVWKLRKWWRPKGGDSRELIVRIVRHPGQELYRPEVIRLRTIMDSPKNEYWHNVWWQPLRGWDMACPLALAVALRLEGDGDAVLAAYRDARTYTEETGDWVEAPPSAAPRRMDDLSRGSALHDHIAQFKQSQAASRLPRGQQMNAHTVVMDELDYSTLEQRLAHKRVMDGAVPTIGTTSIVAEGNQPNWMREKYKVEVDYDISKWMKWAYNI